MCKEEEIRKPIVPGNTQRSTSWAVKVFSAVKACEEVGLESCPLVLLEWADPDDLCKWLALCERRSANGRNYPPSTI